MKILTSTDIRHAIKRAQLSHQIVCIHASLKSFGELEGGSSAILQAFLDEGCTVVAPTFTYEFEVFPPEGMRPQQNGYDYSIVPAHLKEHGGIYNPRSQDISKDMGAIPKAVLAVESCFRGNHPLNSFTAIGPKAKALIESQTPLNVYAPFEQMYHDDGYIILMGVDLRRTTAIHYGELRAGRSLFVRWAKDEQGHVQKVKVGSCSEGFNHFAPVVSAIERMIYVGKSLWRIYPFMAFIDRIVAEIQRNPMITHCDNEDCLRCHDMVNGGCVD